MSADRAWYNRMVAEQMRNCGDISDCPEGGSESGAGEHADVSDKATLRDGREEKEGSEYDCFVDLRVEAIGRSNDYREATRINC